MGDVMGTVWSGLPVRLLARSLASSLTGSLARGLVAGIVAGVVAGLAAGMALGPAPAHAQDLRPDRAAFRAIYRELVETDSSEATGSCTRAAEAMAAHLRAAGYPEADLRVITPDGRPDDGNLVAVLHGSSRQRAVLLLAHIDVVNANRADWERDPFKLVEESGFMEWPAPTLRRRI